MNASDPTAHESYEKMQTKTKSKDLLPTAAIVTTEWLTLTDCDWGDNVCILMLTTIEWNETIEEKKKI